MKSISLIISYKKIFHVTPLHPTDTHVQMNIVFCFVLFFSHSLINGINLILFHEIDYVSPVFMAIMCC